MRFPSLLKKAKLTARKVLFPRIELEQGSFDSYNDWKAALGIDVLTPALLRRIYRSGSHRKEIRQLFINNNKFQYLTEESHRKSMFIKYPAVSAD